MIVEAWHIAAIVAALVLFFVAMTGFNRAKKYDWCQNCRRKHERRPMFMNGFDYWNFYCKGED